MDDRFLAFVFRLFDREPKRNQLLARLWRHGVEALAQVVEIGRQRHAEFAHFARPLHALSEDLLLEARHNRLAVDGRRKAEEVLGRTGPGNGDDVVDPLVGHVGKRKRDHDLDRRVGRVEKAIVDANQLRRNAEIFRPQFDRVVLGENQPAGGEFGAGIVGPRLNGYGHRDGEPQRA